MWVALHLVRRHLISADAFVDAVETVLKSRAPIGRLAVEARYLSMKQVFEILSIQSTTSELFGRIAVRLGHLTERQVADLLAKQAFQDKSIGEVLVAQGAISQEQMTAELAVFHQMQMGPVEVPFMPVSAS